MSRHPGRSHSDGKESVSIRAPRLRRSIMGCESSVVAQEPGPIVAPLKWLEIGESSRNQTRGTSLLVIRLCRIRSLQCHD